MQRLRLDRQRVCWRRSTLRLYAGWVWDVFFIETIAIVEIVGCPLRRKLTDKIGGNNDYDKADASNVKINVIKEIIKGLGL